MSEWISVKELLPDADFEVIVCSDDDVFISVLRRGWDDCQDYFECEVGVPWRVTHWMPLPEPPNAQQ